jgi:hypothetical protein
LGHAQGQDRGHQRGEAALVAIRPSTGEILAMVGGAKGFSLSNQFNRAWQARRQPGSSFKAVRLHRRDRQRHDADDADRRLAGALSDGRRHAWAPQDDDDRFLGPGHAALRAGAVAQRRGGQTGRTTRHRPGDRVRAPHGRALAARSQSLARARQQRGHAARHGRGLRDDRRSGHPHRSDRDPARRDSLGSPMLDNRYPARTKSSARAPPTS